VNTGIYDDEPVLKKSRFDHYDKTESLKDILPKPKNQIFTTTENFEDDLNVEDDNVDIIPKDSKLDNFFEENDGVVEKKKDENLENLVDESLKDILNGVESVKKDAVRVGMERKGIGKRVENNVEKKKLLDVNVVNKEDNKSESNKVLPKVDDVLKSIPVKQTMVGPRIPLEIRKRQANDLLNKTKNVEVINNNQELQNNNTVWNQDFVREWARMNPGNKFEQVE